MFFAGKSEFAEGNCVNSTKEEMEWFHSETGWRKAQKICERDGGCPAREACLALALEQETKGDKRYGVFGGMSAAARTREFG